MSAAHSFEPPSRPVSVPLLIGVLVVPVVFAWCLIRPGYARWVRVLAFGWLACLLAFSVLIYSSGRRDLLLAEPPSAALANPPYFAEDGQVFRVTGDEFSLIENGMTYVQVRSILGAPDQRDPPLGVREKIVTYVWRNANGSTATVTFEDERVLSRSADGLP